MTEQIFNLCWATLLNAFPSATLTEQGQLIYWNELKDIPDKLFQMGVKDCLNKCKFFPTIVELGEASLRKYRYTPAMTLTWRQALPAAIADGRPKIAGPAETLLTKEEARERLHTLGEQLTARGFSLHVETSKAPKTVACIECGVQCIVPFAELGLKYVLCESCNAK